MYFSWCSGTRARRLESAGSHSGQLRQVACGERHCLLLLSSGTVLSCGDNHCGQLGCKDTARRKRPEPIHAFETLHFELVSCGKEHSLAVCHKGRVFAWGAGSQGQLGTGDTPEVIHTPLKIKFHSAVKIIQVSCGQYHSLALSEDSQVFSWGSNSHGQLGLGQKFSQHSSPQKVMSLQGIPVAQVAAGGTHSFILSLSGTSFGWGSNNAGQLALSGEKVPEQTYKPLAVGALKTLAVTYISCGHKHTAVLTQDGKVFTFGDNSYGQLGRSTTDKRTGPQLLEGIHGLASQVDCGSYHTLVYVYTTGQVVSFGRGPGPASKSTQPENLNMSYLIPSDGLEDVHVKHIFAGTYANFVTTSQKDASSTDVPMKTLPEINRINPSLTEKWNSPPRSAEYRTAESKIKMAFSSPACLTASFLKKRGCEDTASIDIDLQMARDTFKKLTSKRWTSMITQCLSDSMFGALPHRSPHLEALWVFLLLPECPVMHHASNWENLVLPFAKAIRKMTDKSLGVLKQCWASVDEDSLRTLVQMLKDAISSQMRNWDESTEVQKNMKALLGVMKEVHKVNKKAKCQLPENIFHINELSHWMSFDAERLKMFFKENQCFADNTSPVLFSDFPFVFDTVSKIKLLQADAHHRKLIAEAHAFKNNLWMSLIRNEPYPSARLILNVRRTHLVEDALCQLDRVEDTDLCKQLLVGFVGEIRPEAGGSVPEFFQGVFEEMTHKDYGLFIYPDEGPYMWFPVKPILKKKRYFLFGILCGLSLFNLNVANIPFPLALFKKLLNQKPSLEDLIELNPTLGKSLQMVLNCEADDMESLGLFFSIYWDHNTIALIPDGDSIPVDHTRKEQYVSKYVDCIFNTSVNALYMEFQRGFSRVFDKKILRIFQPEELMAATIGNTDYDWEQFEKNSQYLQGYHRLDSTIQRFWKAFHKLALEEKKKFLFFLTGNDRLQVRGIKDINIKFRCPEVFTENDNMRPLTCYHILDLPKYSTLGRMKEALQVAINSCKGFALPRE
ncbi:probable E3 ubiquitin-protein ligase HERC6 isoform X1 [Erinaceus europaeus]|uniref:Probable E3 ubiquitin-protein ligase HERC6 isoform X1 n=2 Tax=Erinaceus europaeus TaxID=9365 RepID=A0ABM3X4Q2_ERIEU|nr:probable E3 ubiquitin-protein ligase HERC6 isoform X1 [Erinaceus europaeus]